jgi:hypothetical protein
VVGKIPKRGLIRWGEHDQLKELLDLARFGISWVEWEVQEDLFTDLLVFLDWCRPSKEVTLVLNIVLGINKDWPQECRRVYMGDKACEEHS